MKRYFYLLSILVMVVALPARAELVIEITQGSQSAIPIAVVPFANTSGAALPEDISQIVSDDLQRTGQFNPLDRGNMLSLPSTAAEVFFRDWRMLGQKYLVIGSIDYTPASKQYKVRYELYDVYSSERVVGEVVSGGETRLRDLAHYISDAIYESLTGVKGVFSTKIAYVTLEKGTKGKALYQLEVSDADGRRSTVILKSDMPIMSPTWSPDGRQLAYVSFEGKKPSIYMQEIASGKRIRLTNFPGLNSAPAWSPDGSKMAMTLSKDGNAEIYVMDLASRTLQRMTNHYAIDTEPSWSPDGHSLVFTSDRGGGPQIYQMDVSNPSNQKRVTFDGKYNARARYSQDGKSIYFVHQTANGFSMASLDLKTGQQEILSDTNLDDSPSVAPNGSMLIYATRKGGRGVLAVVSMASGAKYILPSQFGDVREPAWSPFLK